MGKKKHASESRFEERVDRLVKTKGLSQKDAEEIVDRVITEKETPFHDEGPRVFATAKGETYFEQGDIRFPVDAKDLNNVVGANGGTNCIDKLMDSQIAALAVANGLTIKPFARELLRDVLTGLVQIVWYRDLEKHESEHLRLNQEKRIELYKRKLAMYKEEPASGSNNGNGNRRSRQRTETTEAKQPRRIGVARPDKWTRTFKVCKGKFTLDSGRETQLYEVMTKLKQGTFTQIVEASKDKVVTCQPLDKIVDRFLKELLGKGAVEEVK